MNHRLPVSYCGDPIRPPAEAESVILQLTTGCPHNHCDFCGAYQRVPFRVRQPQEFRQHALWVREQEPLTHDLSRVFFADGDSLMLSPAALLEAIDIARSVFGQARRFATYAGALGIRCKTGGELQQLKAAGLNTLYLGLESGSDFILTDMNKGASATEMVEAVKHAQQAGLRVSVMVLLGLGGPERSREHALATAEALNRMQPRLLSVLTLMLIPGTLLWQRAQQGSFRLLNQRETLVELRELLAALRLERTVFAANHASSFLPLTGALPRDQKHLLAEIDAALAGQRRLVPDLLRGL
ncbi:MAG TPA: radical SAM protein [Candidatus Ozemobacteraceae bacterium]|nr:radical SAM protein [Candidatus Ozemobacteraceae bacterium]